MPFVRVNATRAMEDFSVFAIVFIITQRPVSQSIVWFKQNIRTRVGSPLAIVRHIRVAIAVFEIEERISVILGIHPRSEPNLFIIVQSMCRESDGEQKLDNSVLIMALGLSTRFGVIISAPRNPRRADCRPDSPLMS